MGKTPPPPVEPNTRVKILKSDKRRLSCAYEGQTGLVVEMAGDKSTVLLDCGHHHTLETRRLQRTHLLPCAMCNAKRHSKRMRRPNYWTGGWVCPECWESYEFERCEREVAKIPKRGRKKG